MHTLKHSKGTLLLVSYYFPPAKAIACSRTWAFAKYLSRLGWRVRVVTPRADVWAEQDPEPFQDADAELVEYVRTGYWFPFLSGDTKASRKTLLGKLGRHLGWRLQVRRGFEVMTGWFRAAGRECRSLKAGDADAVVASGPPFGSFSLARRLAAQIHCPLILDYRDLWTENPFCRALRTERNRAAELRLLAECAAVTTVSDQSAQMLRRMSSATSVHVISNGYDMDRLSRVVPYAFNERAIVYGGMLYPPLRTLDPVLNAMGALAERGALPFRLHYFGPDGAAVETAAYQRGLAAWVVNHGSVSPASALAAVAGAHAVVVVNSVQQKADEAERGVIPGKVYEALGLGKRIVLISPEDSDVTGVVGNNGRRFSGNEILHISEYLTQSAASEHPAVNQPPERYSWGRLALAWDQVLAGAVASRPVEGAVVWTGQGSTDTTVPPELRNDLDRAINP
jgi:glycosyltransferase involved in cell wall biosynthesis